MGSRSFADVSIAVLSELRFSIVEAIGSISDSPETATELSRLLKLDKTLTWKLFNFIDSEDLFLGSRFIPGESSFGKFLAVAMKHSTDGGAVQRAENAFREFIRLQKKYAEDRASLNLLLFGMSPEGCEKAYQDQKKASFLAQRFLNGISASSTFLSTIVHQAADGGMRICSMRGFHNIIRFQNNTCPLFKIDQLQVLNASDESISYTRKPLCPLQAPSRNNLIPYFNEFCTTLTPQPEADAPGVFIDDLLGGGASDLNSETNLVTAEVHTYPPGDNAGSDQADSSVTVSCNFPSKLQVVDVFVSDSLNIGDCSVRVYNDLQSGNYPDTPPDKRTGPRLTFDEKITALMPGTSGYRIKEIRWYADMIEAAFSKLGYDISDYMLYRVKIPYPYLPSSVVVRLSNPR